MYKIIVYVSKIKKNKLKKISHQIEKHSESKKYYETTLQ